MHNKGKRRTTAAEEMPSTHRVTTVAGGLSDVENGSRERETEAHTQGERLIPAARWVRGSGLPRPRIARGDRGTARDNDTYHGAVRQTPAQRYRHGATGAPGATGLGHGTMPHITGRCGRHRHNGTDTGQRGRPGQRGWATGQCPVSRGAAADTGTTFQYGASDRSRDFDGAPGTATRSTGQLAVPGTASRHATSTRHGPRPRLPTSCPGDSGLFARRQGQNPVVVSLT